MIDQIWKEELREMIFVNIFSSLIKRNITRNYYSWNYVSFTKHDNWIEIFDENIRDRMKKLNYWIIWDNITFKFVISQDNVTINKFKELKQVYIRQIEFIFLKLLEYNYDLNKLITNNLYMYERDNSFFDNIYFFKNIQWYTKNIFSFFMYDWYWIKKLKLVTEKLKDHIWFFKSEKYWFKNFDNKWKLEFINYIKNIFDQIESKYREFWWKNETIQNDHFSNTFENEEMKAIYEYFFELIELYKKINYNSSTYLDWFQKNSNIYLHFLDWNKTFISKLKWVN